MSATQLSCSTELIEDWIPSFNIAVGATYPPVWVGPAEAGERGAVWLSDDASELYYARANQQAEAGWTLEHWPLPSPPADLGTAYIAAAAAFGCVVVTVGCLADMGGVQAGAVQIYARSANGSWAPVTLDAASGAALQGAQSLSFTSTGSCLCLLGNSVQAAQPGLFVLSFAIGSAGMAATCAPLTLAAGDGTPNITALGWNEAITALPGDGSGTLGAVLVSPSSGARYWAGTLPASGGATLQAASAWYANCACANAQTIAMPGCDSAVLAVGDAGELMLVTAQGGTDISDEVYGPLQNASVSACFDDSDAVINVFVVDSTHTLWIRRAYYDHTNSLLGLGEWTMLNSGVQAAFGPTSGNGVTLYVTDAQTQQLGMLVQSRPPVLQSTYNTSGSRWLKMYPAGQPLQAPQLPPGSSNLPDAAYGWLFTATDANGAPVPGTQLQVSADQPAMLVAGSSSYQVGPGLTQTFTTDGQGQLELRCVGDAMASPVLSVQAGFMPAGAAASYPADAQMHARLAGMDANFPMNGAALQQAQIIDSGYSSDVADRLATTMTTLGQAMWAKRAASSGAARAERIDLSTITAPRAFHIDFSSGVPAVSFLNAEQFAAIASPATWLGNTWNDLTAYLKSTYQKIVSFGAQLVEQGVQVVVNGMTALLTEVSEMADALEVLIGECVEAGEAALQKALMWVRKAFSWSDIRNTQQVLQYVLAQSLQNIANGVQDLVAQAVTVVSGGTQPAAQSMAAALGPDATVTSTAPQGMPAWMGNGAGAPGLANVQSGSSVMSGYLLRRFNEAAAAAPATAGVQARLGDGSFDGGLAAMSQCASTINADPSFSASAGNARSWAQGCVNGGSVAAGSAPLAGLLGVAGPLADAAAAVPNSSPSPRTGVSSAVAVLLDTLGGCVAAVPTGVAGLLQTRPFSSPLFDWLIGDGPTLGELITWPLALLCTEIYKLTVGLPGATAPFDDSTVQEILATPLPWPGMPALSSTRAVGAPAWTRTLTYIAAPLGLLGAGLSYAADLVAVFPNPSRVVPVVAQCVLPVIDTLYWALNCPAYTGTPVQGLSDGDKGAWLAWGACTTGFLLDWIALFCSTPRLLRFQPFGNVLGFIGGLLQLAACVKAAILIDENKGSTYTMYNVAATLLAPLPLMIRIALATADADPPISTAFAVAACGAGDVYIGGAAVALTLASCIPSS